MRLDKIEYLRDMAYQLGLMAKFEGMAELAFVFGMAEIACAETIAREQKVIRKIAVVGKVPAEPDTKRRPSRRVSARSRTALAS